MKLSWCFGVTSLAVSTVPDQPFVRQLFQLRENSKAVAQRCPACNFTKKETLAQVFFLWICEISKNTFSYRTPTVAASKQWHHKEVKIKIEVNSFSLSGIRTGRVNLCMFSELTTNFDDDDDDDDDDDGLFSEWLTDKRCYNFSSRNHCQRFSPPQTFTQHEQDLHLHKTWVQALLNEVV